MIEKKCSNCIYKDNCKPETREFCVKSDYRMCSISIKAIREDERFKFNRKIDKLKSLFQLNEKYKGKVIIGELDKMYQRQYIRNWDELSKLPPSHKGYILTVKDCCAEIHHQTLDFYDYFSTHTFYGNTYQQSSKRLQDYGWDVELANWDATDGQ